MARSYDDLKMDIAKASLRSALQCIENENYDGAEEQFEAALEAKDDFADARLEYGYFLMRMGRGEEAEANLRRAMDLAPDAYRPYYHLAYVYINTEGKEEDGLSLYRRAMELAPAEHSILSEYAGVLLNMGRLAGAEKAYQELLAAAGEKAYTYCCLGYVQMQKEAPDLARAAAYYDKGFALLAAEGTDACEYLWAYANAAEMALKAGDGAKALGFMKTLLEHDPFTYIDVFEGEPAYAAVRGEKRYAEMTNEAQKAYGAWLKENATVMPGEKAPDFKLKDVDGKDVRLSDFKGRPVVLNIWATWCGPCRREIPDISSFYDDYKDKLVVLGVCSEEDMTAEDLRAAAADLGATYPMLLGNEKLDKDYISRSGSIPETYIIGADGKVKDFILGSTTREVLARKVERYLT